MACTSLIELLRECGEEGIMGGISNAYVMAFADADVLESSAAGLIYELTPTGIVSELGRKTTKKFVEVGLLPATAGLNEELTVNKQNGSAYLTDTLTLVLAKLTTANRTFVQSVLNQPILVIVKTFNNNYFIGGLSGNMQIATLSGGTGVAEGDLQGYTITFTGTSTILIPMVDPVLFPDLIIPAP